MKNNPTELFNVLLQLREENLTAGDLEDLLVLFSYTKNHALRNHLAKIFCNVHYEPAVPVIFEKILDKCNYNHTGTLVFALESFDLKNYLKDLVQILLSPQSFEALMTLEYIIERHLDSFLQIDKEEARTFLVAYRLERSPNWDIDKDTHYYVDAIINLLSA